MKRFFTLMILLLSFSIGYGQKKIVYYDGEGVQAQVQYIGGLNRITSILIAGKRPGKDKLEWLETSIDSKKTVTVTGKTLYEFEVTDENKQSYRTRLFADFSPSTITKFNTDGKAIRVWDVKARNPESAKGNTLTFDGKYAIKFDYDRKTKKMTNLQFSTDKERQKYSNFQVYDIEDYEDGGYKGKLYTVKDGKGAKYTILYSDSFNYIMVNSVDDRMASQTTLYLKK
ncbi:hypothetical protein [Sphingobacterium siyangense]|uniref:hypothetical protein n=1 Tax=Sphingobacterium siyangense TaxID=459529 RepID=UPI002FDE9C79